MTGANWDQVSRAARIFEAARREQDPLRRTNLQRAARELLNGREPEADDEGPTWPEVLLSHGK